MGTLFNIGILYTRDEINDKAGKAAALYRLSDTLTLSQSGGRLCPTIGFASLTIFRDYAPASIHIDGE